MASARPGRGEEAVDRVVEPHRDDFALPLRSPAVDDALRGPRRARRARRERPAGPDPRGQRDDRPGGARARRRGGRLPARRALRRRPLLRPVREAGADRARRPETLDFVPPWYGDRMLALGERGAARIGFGGVVWPDALDGLDPALARARPAAVAQGDDEVIDDRSTNWCGDRLPAPAVGGARLPRARRRTRPTSGSGSELWHVSGSTSPTRRPPGTSGSAALKASAEALNERRVRRDRALGPGHRAHGRPAPDLASGRRATS